MVLKVAAPNLFFFIDCAVSELAFSGFSCSDSAGWLAIKAFFTATRLLINDFFWTDILVTFPRGSRAACFWFYLELQFSARVRRNPLNEHARPS
jgi:hypothetical protein